MIKRRVGPGTQQAKRKTAFHFQSWCRDFAPSGQRQIQPQALLLARQDTHLLCVLPWPAQPDTMVSTLFSKQHHFQCPFFATKAGFRRAIAQTQGG